MRHLRRKRAAGSLAQWKVDRLDLIEFEWTMSDVQVRWRCSHGVCVAGNVCECNQAVKFCHVWHLNLTQAWASALNHSLGPVFCQECWGVFTI